MLRKQKKQRFEICRSKSWELQLQFVLGIFLLGTSVLQKFKLTPVCSGQRQRGGSRNNTAITAPNAYMKKKAEAFTLEAWISHWVCPSTKDPRQGQAEKQKPPQAAKIKPKLAFLNLRGKVPLLVVTTCCELIELGNTEPCVRNVKASGAKLRTKLLALLTPAPEARVEVARKDQKLKLLNWLDKPRDSKSECKRKQQELMKAKDVEK